MDFIDFFSGFCLLAKPTRKLTYMYLANDVIQNSKKKGPEFSKEFLSVMKSCFDHIYKYVVRLFFYFFKVKFKLFREIDSTTLTSLERLVKIWEERLIYDRNSIKIFRQALHLKDDSKESNNNSVGEKIPNSKSKKRPIENTNDNGRSSKKVFKEKSETSLNILMSKLVDNHSIDLENYEKVEPEKLMKTLKDLENCASADENARQKISNLPSEVFDLKLIENVLNKDSVEHWTKLVDEAQNILASYNTRLAQELEDRKNLSTMLIFFMEDQRRALSQAEQNLNEYRDKLKKVISVRDELNSHLQNLPDLSQLPTVTPLPSALDLFQL